MTKGEHYLEPLTFRFVHKFFSKLKNSNISGIKILITGRFNGVPRAKGRIIQTGCLPLQSLDSKINYHNTEAQTPYGTFGIKVWISEK